MTTAIRSLEQPADSIFVLHALTYEGVRAELDEHFGSEAVSRTIETVAADKGHAIAGSMTAPESYADFEAQKKRYETAIESGEIEPPKPIEGDEGSLDPLAIQAYLKGYIKSASEPHTLTPEHYAAASDGKAPKIIPAPIKSDWDESIEVDAHKTRRLITEIDAAIIETAVTEVALHPPRKDEDVAALTFLAEHTSDTKGAVSRFILDTARNRRRTRSLLSNVLLRLV